MVVRCKASLFYNPEERGKKREVLIVNNPAKLIEEFSCT